MEKSAEWEPGGKLLKIYYVRRNLFSFRNVPRGVTKFKVIYVRA